MDPLTAPIDVATDPPVGSLPDVVVYFRFMPDGDWFVADLTTPTYNALSH